MSHRLLDARQRRAAFLSGGFGLAVMAVCAVVGVQMVGALDTGLLGAALQQLAPWQWAAALAATGASFLAVGFYDATWHRITGTQISPARARGTGMAAVAVSQALGATAVTAAIARWRLLPDVPVWKVVTISGGVGLSFLLCWGVVVAGAALYLGAGLGLPIGWILCAAGAALTLAVLIAPRFLTVSAKDAGVMALCTTLDLTFAGLALWVLLPDPLAVPALNLLAAYTLALGAGLISNSPGGAGPFELALLALLPALPAEELLAGIIAFRLVYYLLPFGIGAVVLARAPKEAATETALRRRADWALSQQSGGIRRCAGGWAHVVPVAGATVVIGDPDAPTKLPRRSDVFYKISQRYAVTLRRADWYVHRLADEAVIPLGTWTLDIPARKRLRQALRRAARAGLTVERATGPLPLTRLTHIAQGWARDHGGELGTTVGRFSPALLPHQEVILIRLGDAIVGFATFNTGEDGWSLDLMRYLPDLPDGALHAAIVCGIDAAAAAGAPRMNLGAVPAFDGVLARWAGRKAGLRQFKNVFAPRWEPRYLAARHEALLAVIGPLLALRIQRPVARAVTRLHNNMQISQLHSALVAGRTGHLDGDPNDKRPIHTAD